MSTETEAVDREWREARDAEWGHGHGQALADYHHGTRMSAGELASYPEQYLPMTTVLLVTPALAAAPVGAGREVRAMSGRDFTDYETRKR